jgi:ABC-type dipeptide/oligopeptide/nickel transport system permease component
MSFYLVRRILVSVPTVIGITILIFLVMRVLPGDPVSVVFGQESFNSLSAADQARFRADLGLDQPLHVQYLEWMAAVARGDFGRSFWRNDTVRDLLIRRGPITIQIAVMAITFAWIVGIPVGGAGEITASACWQPCSWRFRASGWAWRWSWSASSTSHGARRSRRPTSGPIRGRTSR